VERPLVRVRHQGEDPPAGPDQLHGRAGARCRRPLDASRPAPRAPRLASGLRARRLRARGRQRRLAGAAHRRRGSVAGLAGSEREDEERGEERRAWGGHGGQGSETLGARLRFRAVLSVGERGHPRQVRDSPRTLAIGWPHDPGDFRSLHLAGWPHDPGDWVGPMTVARPSGPGPMRLAFGTEGVRRGSRSPRPRRRRGGCTSNSGWCTSRRDTGTRSSPRGRARTRHPRSNPCTGRAARKSSSPRRARSRGRPSAPRSRSLR
jgi:hypothetical protein